MNAIDAASKDHRYSRAGVTMPGLRNTLSEQADDGKAPAKHLVHAAVSQSGTLSHDARVPALRARPSPHALTPHFTRQVDALVADGMVTASGSGAAKRLHMTEAARGGLRKLKLAARVIGKLQ